MKFRSFLLIVEIIHACFAAFTKKVHRVALPGTPKMQQLIYFWAFLFSVKFIGSIVLFGSSVGKFFLNVGVLIITQFFSVLTCALVQIPAPCSVPQTSNGDVVIQVAVGVFEPGVVAALVAEEEKEMKTSTIYPPNIISCG